MSHEDPHQFMAEIRARAAAEFFGRSERAVRQQASRDAAEAETRRLDNEPLRMAMLRAEQDNARREEALATNRAQEDNRLRDQTDAAASDARAAERRAARDERNRAAMLEQQAAIWDDVQALRADQDLARRQRLVDDLSEGDRGDRALSRRIALIAQQNRQRDLRAERRDVPSPDVPLPNVPGIASRVADGFAEALAWMRRRAEVSEEDQLVRDAEDVIAGRDDDSQTCTSCLVHKREVICLPCGHCAQCNHCWRTWKNRKSVYGGTMDPTCTVCRALVVHTLPITQKQRHALSAENVVDRPRHAGSRAHRVPAGPIFMNAQMPGAPLLSMHSLLDGISG